MNKIQALGVFLLNVALFAAIGITVVNSVDAKTTLLWVSAGLLIVGGFLLIWKSPL